MTIVFENAQLIPAEWKSEESLQTVRAFNPGLLRAPKGWLLAYRIVAGPQFQRRIALCRLDDGFHVEPDSIVPFSDYLQFPEAKKYPPEVTTWFADPRLYRLENRLFVYWNSGWHEPQNHQFLQELDPATLLPLGSPRELVLRGDRQKLEKNWMLFEQEGLFAIYSVNPHRILRFSLTGDGPIEFVEVTTPAPNAGGHALQHGGLRGGAPPQLCNDRFYSFCHSIEDDPDGYRYVASVYRFAGEFPFAPTDMPRERLPLQIPAFARRSLPKLNPAVGEVNYPAGAAFYDGQWVISLGIDDERCAITVLDANTVVATLLDAS